MNVTKTKADDDDGDNNINKNMRQDNTTKVAYALNDVKLMEFGMTPKRWTFICASVWNDCHNEKLAQKISRRCVVTKLSIFIWPSSAFQYNPYKLVELLICQFYVLEWVNEFHAQKIEEKRH